MGWDFYADPSMGKADIEAEVTRPHTRPCGGYHRTLRKRWKGNKLWCVHESLRDGQLHRYVALYLARRSGGCWGYKAIDETMGPYETDCPIAFLDDLTEPIGCAAEWRAKVRARHPGHVPSGTAATAASAAPGEQVGLWGAP